MSRERKAKGFRGTPAVLRETNDEVRDIRQILRDPEHHLTPRLREVADDLTQIQRETERRDPDLPGRAGAGPA